MLGEQQIQDLLKRQKPPFIFLESASPEKENGKTLLFNDFKTQVVFRHGDDLEKFFSLLEAYRAKGFWLAGYFTYEFGYYLEDALGGLRQNFDFPLAWLAVCAAPQKIKPGKKPQALENLHYRIDNVRASIGEEGYVAAIDRIKQYLGDGTTYQVNYTFKQGFDFSGSTADFYLGLRRMQPTDYSAFIETLERTIVSLSPELFFETKKRKIISRPMKGTSERGVETGGDAENLRALQSDPKVRAENLMIVDLMRNDLGRICEKVRTAEMFAIEKHPTLFQMTSTVGGRLRAKTTLKDIFYAIFPCGSVTGAPKISTMKIIAGLENSPRGIYTGAIGYISPREEMCFSVAIRTAQIKNSRGELGVGGGIVYDSQALAEHKEAHAKALFLTRHYPYFEFIETILWEKGKGYYLLDGHLARLEQSCRYFSRPFNKKIIARSLRKIEKKFAAEKIRVRLLLTPHGDTKLEAREYIPESAPVKISVYEHRVDPGNLFLYHKTTCRYWYDEALHHAKANGCREVVFLNEKGEVTEGSFSNVFIEEQGILFTPPIACGLLPGVLRGSLLAQGKAKEKVLYPGDLKTAGKLYIGNSVRGLVAAKLT